MKSFFPIALILFFVAASFVASAPVNATWYNNSFAYKTQVNISNPNTSLPYYVLRMNLTSSQINLSNIQPNCYDVRIVNSTENGLIPYYMECNISGQLRLWANVTNGTSSFYIYYGSPTAANASNGNNVFDLFFDNFVFNDTKFIISFDGVELTINDTGNAYNDGGSLTINSHSLGGGWWADARAPIIEQDNNTLAAEWYFRIYNNTGGAGTYIGSYFTNLLTSPQGIHTVWYPNRSVGYYGAGVGDTMVGAYKVETLYDHYFIYNMTAIGGNHTFDWYINGTKVCSTCKARTNVFMTSIGFGWDTSGVIYSVDNMKIYKQPNTPPIYALGSEEEIPDITSPTVAIQFPEAKNYIIGNITVNFTATDDIGVAYCQQELDGSANVSIPSCNNYTMYGLGDSQNHTLKIFANDSAGNVGFASRTFGVDASIPQIDIQSPYEDSLFNTTSVNLNYTAFNTVNMSSCWYILDDGNETSLGACTNTTLNALSEGNRTITVFGNDTMNVTGNHTHYFTIDTTPPAITVTQPNGTKPRQPQLQVTFTATDANGINASSCSYAIDAGNRTPLSPCSSQEINYDTAGNHTLIIFAKDNAGNEGNGGSSFEIVNVPPVVTIYAPIGTKTSYQTYLNFTATGAYYCWYKLDGGTNTSIPSCDNMLISTAAGSHNLTIYANNSYNVISSASTTFTRIEPPVPNVTGGTALVYVLLPLIFALLIFLYVLSGVMSGSLEIKEAFAMILLGIMLITVAAVMVGMNV